MTDFDAALVSFVNALKVTLEEEENGYSIAAPQVGLLKRVFVVKRALEPEKNVFINPTIIRSSKNDKKKESCLSLPDCYAIVKRPTKVLVEAFDVTGEKFQIEAEGLLARALLHEYDHLDGTLFVDLLESHEDIMFIEEPAQVPQ